MNQLVSITSKWQIHIPVAFRRKLKLDKPSSALLSISDGAIMIKPTKSKILTFAAKYKRVKPVKPLNLDKIRDVIDYSQW